MDIVKSRNAGFAQKWFASKKWLLIFAALGVVVFGFALRTKASSMNISRDALVVGVVKKGRFDVTVDGYGELKSSSTRLITSVSKATVEEVVLKPGAKVVADSVILRMSNPQIDQDLDLARQQLESEKISVQEITLTKQRELQDEDAKLLEAQSQLELIEMRQKALADLAKQRILSHIEYAEINMKVEQQRRNLKIQRERYATLQQINRAQIDIHKKMVEQKQLAYDKVQEQKDKLTVRAGREGTLQLLYVELGQSIEPGKELALVGGDKDLNALIKIPQSKSDSVRIGQQARISIGGNPVLAKVAQINPGVVDGSVTVELQPRQALPDNARPNLNVDAVIEVGSFDNALFVDRPANVVANSSTNVFVVDKDGDNAARVAVAFGQESGKQIQIKSGLADGAQVVLSDVSKYAAEKSVSIVD
ncbi:efflux RND transporter periplasmic adaptor subunit [Lysobacter enzymogenes]|uniref:efflux RND transporter periplasmic adaptor subunit n=1 Tax=Lysobacter enzymogenes TaxID=69 RepID=UPI0008986E38|nr:HlyD family efflux transporter periplasmic adaptor subunit [Lysobacter enzymogenes]SDW73903.1 HlyD family secretion protein [Lysobacter enzymogenes]